MIDREKLCKYAQDFGITLDETAINRIDEYSNAVLEKNKVMNLTAITDADGFLKKHIADSLSLFSAVRLSAGDRVLDVGTGAGFPGMVLLIAKPDIDLYLLDGTKKKLDFIGDAAADLDLCPTTIHLRAEEAGKMSVYREKFDVVTARAVANLTDLCEYCLPFVRVGGVFAAMKGADSDAEISAARRAVSLLGGEIAEIKRFELDDIGSRSIIVIKKKSQTPIKYPRASTQIAKKSLE